MYSFFQGKIGNSIFYEDGLVGEVQYNPGKKIIFHFQVSV